MASILSRPQWVNIWKWSQVGNRLFFNSQYTQDYDRPNTVRPHYNVILFYVTKDLTWGWCHIVPRIFTMYAVTHWSQVTHKCISKLTIIGTDNGSSPGRRQAIIWNKVGILLIWARETNFSEILIKIYTFSFKKMHLKLSSGIWRPFCFGLNVLMNWYKRDNNACI